MAHCSVLPVDFLVRFTRAIDRTASMPAATAALKRWIIWAQQRYGVHKKLAYLLYMLVSAAGGLLVGLIGTGSSLLVLPSLALIFAATLDGSDTLRLAAGTTMATMSAGAIAGALTQYRRGNVDTALLRMMLPPYVVGALTGPWVSRVMPTGALEIYLAVIIAIIAVRMVRTPHGRSATGRDYRHHRLQIAVVMAIIGVCSSVAGIASGVFAIPYLTRFTLSLRTIIGTSTAAAAVYGVCGAIGYVSAGWSAAGLPPQTLGYVYLPAFAVMAITAVVATPLGVRLAGRVNEQVLRRLFAVFLLLAALGIILV